MPANDHDIRLNQVLREALIPKGFRPTAPADIEAMLDAFSDEKPSDEKLARMLKKVRGSEPLYKPCEHECQRTPESLTGEQQALVALYRDRKEETPPDILSKLNKMRERAGEQAGTPPLGSISSLPWKLLQTLRDHAMDQGEQLAKLFDFFKPPIDPFTIIAEEPLLHAEGDDFGDAFDGCLQYLGNRFLLAFNTKYNTFSKEGDYHPRIRFTIGHELGHFFLDEHRSILKSGGPRFSCVTGFQSDPQLEHQADCFAAGLLMPGYLLAPMVNSEAQPDLSMLKEAAARFRVSLTSMMIRWVRLSDFPCAAFALSGNRVAWSWTSESLRRVATPLKHSRPVIGSNDAQVFLRASGTLDNYREGRGQGLLRQWLETDHDQASVSEWYTVNPYTSQMLAFVVADESEVTDDDD